MKIGIFDSGLGGLIILKSIIEKMPEYDYVYFGDTLHLPYGDKPAEKIYEYSEKIVDYLFSKCNCNLVIIACNTATSVSLFRLQNDFIPKKYPNRKILGVIIPTIEMVNRKENKVGVLATQATVNSKVYEQEFKKYFGDLVKVYTNAAPLLVKKIEDNDLKDIDNILKEYISPLLKKDITTLILGCTHYPFLKDRIRKIIPKDVKLLSQDEFIPIKLLDYLKRHTEIEENIGKNSNYSFILSDLKEKYVKNSEKIFNITTDNFKEVRL